VAVGQGTSYTTFQSNGQDFYLNMKGTGSTVFRNGSGDTERMRLDNNGNLGLGVTPSAWGSGYKALQLPAGTYGGGALVSDNGSPNIAANCYNNSGWKYVTTGDNATLYQSRSGQHQWFTAPSGTAGDAISFTQALTLNTNGALVLQGGDTAASGVGIAFPATQVASSNANTLDDYEEGTWTPAISGLTLGNGTASGQYTKVGNSVSVQFKITLGSTSSVTSLVTLSGFPFSISGFVASYVDVLDAGTIQYSAVVATYDNSSTVDIRGLRSSGTYVDSYIMSTTAPVTWTESDCVTGSFTYRAG
jgi:hypothetical protein